MTNLDGVAGAGEITMCADSDGTPLNPSLEYQPVPSNSPVVEDEDMHDAGADGRDVTSDVNTPASSPRSLPGSTDTENTWVLMTQRDLPFKVHSTRSQYGRVLGRLEMGAVIKALPETCTMLGIAEKWFTIKFEDLTGYVLREDGPHGFVPVGQCPLAGTWSYSVPQPGGLAYQGEFRILLTNPQSYHSSADVGADAYWYERATRVTYNVPLYAATHERYQPPPSATFEPQYGGRDSASGVGIWFAINDDGKLESIFHTDDQSHATTSERVALGEGGKKEEFPGERTESVPGRCGLSNLGNTCFMNSAIQCTSACPDLVKYFTSDLYKANLNRDNPVGAKGELAEAYSALMKAMWSGKYESCSPTALKKVVDQYQPRFAGYSQHDSQEYLQYLLDGLHEDVNVVKKKPYFDDEEIEKLPDREKAEEAWSRHVQRNKSHVARLFQGQLRSSLQCNVCGHRATRFDPSAVISVPVQLEHQIYNAVEVFFFAKDIRRPAVKLLMKHRTSKDAVCLKKEVAETVGCAAKNLVLQQEGTRYLAFEAPIIGREGPAGEGGLDMSDIIAGNDEITIVEDTPTPSPTNTATPVAAKTEEPETFTLKIVEGYGQTWSGGWYQVRLPVDVTVAELHAVLSKLLPAPTLLRPTASPEIVPVDPPADDLDEDAAILSGERDAVPSPSPVVVAQKFGVTVSHRSMDVCETDTQVLADTISSYAQKVVTVTRECNRPAMLEDPRNEEVEKWQQEASKQSSKTLPECFETYTEEEQLDDSDAWYCGKCKEQVNAFKRMSIWRPPPYLVVHLNRFSYTQHSTYRYGSFGSARRKIDVPIHYGEELDLRPSIHPGSPAAAPDSKTLYELVAVSCHSGAADYGHYTAYGKVDGTWCNFNDKFVSAASLGDACNNTAYMLIYAQKDMDRGALEPPAPAPAAPSACTYPEVGEGLLATGGVMYPTVVKQGLAHTVAALKGVLETAAAADPRCVGYCYNATPGSQQYLHGALQYSYAQAHDLHAAWPPQSGTAFDTTGSITFHQIGGVWGGAGPVSEAAATAPGGDDFTGWRCHAKPL